MNQKGFATLEVILMVMVIGILATVAVPRFTDVTTKANTAKIQSDLATIDTAIDMYYMEKGSYIKTGTTTISTVGDLSDYIKDAANLKPPTGTAYINGGSGTIEISATDTYTIGAPSESSSAKAAGGTRALLKGYVAGDFHKKSDT